MEKVLKLIKKVLGIKSPSEHLFELPPLEGASNDNKAGKDTKSNQG